MIIKTGTILKYTSGLPYKALKRTSALSVQETLDREDVMNLVTTGISNAFTTLQDEVTSLLDPTATIYDSSTPPPLMEATPNAPTLNSATSTVSDPTL